LFSLSSRLWLAGETGWTPLDYANINFWFQLGYAIGFVGQACAWLRGNHDPEDHPQVSREELSYVREGAQPEPSALPYSCVQG
jgi:hypothetical protein